MVNNNSRLNKTSEESITTTREVLKASLASIEKLTKVNLEASKKFLEQTAQALKEMTRITNPKELFDKVNKLASHTVESNMTNCRDVYNILSETQARISKMLESHVQTTQKKITEAAGKFSKLNPDNKTGFSSEALKNWITSTNKAMETLSKIAAQATKVGSTAATAHNSKPAAKATAKTSVKTTTKSTAKTTPKAAAKPTAKATAKKPVKATVKPKAKITTKAAAKPVAKATVKPTPEKK